MPPGGRILLFPERGCARRCGVGGTYAGSRFSVDSDRLPFGHGSGLSQRLILGAPTPFDLHRASRIVLSLSGTGLLLGIAYTENAPLLIVFVLISLYLAGLIGSFVYGRTALSLRGCDCMGRLCALGMGLAAVLQIVVSFLALPLPLCALLLSAAMAASIYMLARERTANESLNGPVPDGWALPPLWLLLLGVAVISLMGGFNDGVLTSQQASGALNLYAAPRLFYFVGMALAGGIADRFRLSGLSILVLCVMVCSTAGALFMSSPATMALNAGLYSLFAGIVIIYFTVPFFQTADGKTPRSGPASGGWCGFPPWRWGLRAMSIF